MRELLWFLDLCLLYEDVSALTLHRISFSPCFSQTHFRTIFALINGATGGAGSILVTATVQTPESMYAEKKPLFDNIMASYGKMK